MTMVKLAMQFVVRLIGYHVELSRLGFTQPFQRLEPDRVAGAIIIIKPSNRVRENFDLTAWGF
jgi:hypothetical protein